MVRRRREGEHRKENAQPKGERAHWQRLCKTSADEPSTDAVGSASSQLFESQLSPTGECKCTDNPCAADKSFEGAGASRKSAATASEAPAWALLRVYSDPLLQHFIQQKRCCIRTLGTLGCNLTPYDRDLTRKDYTADAPRATRS